MKELLGKQEQGCSCKPEPSGKQGLTGKLELAGELGPTGKPELMR